jgi:hypothetical protein
LIDFSFGGEDFISKCKDVIEQVGHVTVDFTFKFSDDDFTFTRSTYEPLKVIFHHEKEPNKTLDDLKLFLFNKYMLEHNGPSFRSMVSRFVRIWKKGNDNPKIPFNAVPSESYSTVKDFIIKLFGYYPAIAELSELRKKQEVAKGDLDAAFKQGYIEKINSTEYKKYKLELSSIDAVLYDIKSNLEIYISNINLIVNEKNLSITIEKDKVLAQKLDVESKIVRLNNNIEGNESVKNVFFNKLVDFFPEANIDKIKNIETFHNSISKILKSQIKLEINNLELQLEEINSLLSNYDAQLKEITSVIDTPKELVDEVLRLTIKQNKLSDAIKYKDIRDNLESGVKELKKDVKLKTIEILDIVSNEINSELEKVSEYLYGNVRIHPEIKLAQSNYELEHFNDTGAGKAYSDMIAFDISMLNITVLPILIEDSMIFKNIESPTNEKLINLFIQQDKQVFIAMDQLGLLDVSTQKKLRKYCFIRVSKRMPAFKKLWNKPNERKASNELIQS